MDNNRYYLPGSKWLYYRIELNPNSARGFLVNYISPLMRELEKKEVHAWYFIRYNVPSEQIRLRIKCEDKKVKKAIWEIKKTLQPLLENHVIHGVEIATYQREMERYGEDNIELCEVLFCAETRYIIAMWKENRSDVELFYKALGMAYNYLQIIIEDEKIIEKIVNMQYDEFANEFNVKPLDYRELNALYGKNSIGIEKTLKLNNKCNLEKDIEKVIIEFRKIEVSDKIVLATSLVHMLINRLFDNEPRKAELVIYHHMHRYIKKLSYVL